MKHLIAFVPGIDTNLDTDNQLELIKNKNNTTFNEGTINTLTGRDQGLAGTFCYDDKYNIYTIEVYVSNNNNKLIAAYIIRRMEHNRPVGNETVVFSNVSSLTDAASLMNRKNISLGNLNLTKLSAANFREAVEQVNDIQAESKEETM